MLLQMAKREMHPNIFCEFYLIKYVEVCFGGNISSTGAYCTFIRTYYIHFPWVEIENGK